MDKQKAKDLFDKYCNSGKYRSKLKVIKYRQLENGGWVFGVFVAYQGDVVEVTNLFAIIIDRPLTEKNGNWETKANPGYDLETWVNELN